LHAGVWDGFVHFEFVQFVFASTPLIAKGFAQALKFIISA